MQSFDSWFSHVQSLVAVQATTSVMKTQYVMTMNKASLQKTLHKTSLMSTPNLLFLK